MEAFIAKIFFCLIFHSFSFKPPSKPWKFTYFPIKWSKKRKRARCLLIESCCERGRKANTQKMNYLNYACRTYTSLLITNWNLNLITNSLFPSHPCTLSCHPFESLFICTSWWKSLNLSPQLFPIRAHIYSRRGGKNW